MYECAQIAIYITDDGKPVVQFIGTPLFMGLEPVGKAVAVTLAAQLSDVIVKGLIEQNPDVASEITETLKGISLEPHDTTHLMN